MMDRRVLLLRGAGLPLLAATGLAACAQPQVESRIYDAGPLPRPERVLVHDFAVHPQEVRLDSGLRGRLMAAFAGEGTTEQQLQAARQVSSAVTQALVETLREGGIPAERVFVAEPPGPGRFLLVDGQVLGVDEGNRTRRTLVGLGAGMSSVDVAAQLYLLEAGRPRRPLEALSAHVDSGRTPGMAETMGAGAVAGRIATSAAVGHVGQAAMQGSRADDVGEARRLGTSLAAQVRGFASRQGWT